MKSSIFYQTLLAVFAIFGSLYVESENIPTKNPWLNDSVYPISHHNSAQTDASVVDGPQQGKRLKVSEVKTVAMAWCSAPTLKKIGDETIVIAANPHGIVKIRASGEAFDVISNEPYPGGEDLHAQVTEEKLSSVMSAIDKRRRNKQHWWLWARSLMMYKQLYLNQRTMGSGAYALVDKEGYHYTVFDRHYLLKSFDNNEVMTALTPIKHVNMLDMLPSEIAAKVDRILGINLTQDGYLVLAATGAVLVFDRELKLKDTISFPGEYVENSIALDEHNGIYVVTSKRMHKLVWTGRELSQRKEDGAWASSYDVMPEGEALELGAVSHGSGTTPTLMGFGDDEDKLVVIADSRKDGAQIVAFWRDNIPDSFKQKAGTLSRRIADQRAIDLGTITVEASPLVYGYGVLMMNTSYPQPTPITMDVVSNAFMAGVTRKAPTGVQKFNWNVVENHFEKSWLLPDVDNSDWMPPTISASTGLAYIANKQNGRYEYLGVDWRSGDIQARWVFPDDSVLWNSWGGITTLLEDGDFLLGGFFALKRFDVDGR